MDSRLRDTQHSASIVTHPRLLIILAACSLQNSNLARDPYYIATNPKTRKTREGNANMAAALNVAPPPPAVNMKAMMAAQGHSCPRCGTQVPIEQEVEEAQRKIRELEAQVEMLKEKATSAGTSASHSYPYTA